ncbi:sterol desaturase/sphingolipid hydroxylase (fatty acid hydroxylase superfamily) [Archangium gephyra]|uniref:Sterol desaturase/sphingolipid hydroxylase (Fatty acid hydroxylase superfamily) n=1 Tax=Archangium gephyra TaxID=48 RepID=A0ABX9JP25_9BACT|nr:sterol desaturase family protein [Archangium gephyra]REG23340.1 sterol desaturase/sphingolipid hydroxylase (fatty acid hydroxylase superfamily) [Archangium gephyra]
MADLQSLDPTQLATPAFLLLMAVELLWLARHRQEGYVGYTVKDSAASLTMGTVYSLIYMGWKGVEYAFYSVLYEASPLRMGDGLLAWVLLFFAEDLCYYWFHRVHHESRVFWASHVVHHSSEHYNLSTALRQTWTPMSGLLFWAPLPLLGFHPAMVLAAHAISLLYQFWIHTEAIGRMGPLEWVLNTPSHHRVHHGANPRYLDRNYAGVLILWDRLFGTFQAEDERPIYGLTKNIHTYNPLRIAFHEYAAILRDVLRPNPLRVRLGLVFRGPGWKPPEGSVPAAGDGAVLRAEEGGGQLPSHPGA